MFLFGAAAPPSPAPVPDVSSEFDQLLNSKDLELQAILGGNTPAAEATAPAPAATDSLISNSAVVSGARPVRQQTVAPAPAPSSTRVTTEIKTVLGIPSKYVITVLLTIVVGLLIYFMQSAIWRDTDLNEKKTGNFP